MFKKCFLSLALLSLFLTSFHSQISSLTFSPFLASSPNISFPLFLLLSNYLQISLFYFPLCLLISYFPSLSFIISLSLSQYLSHSLTLFVPSPYFYLYIFFSFPVYLHFFLSALTLIFDPLHSQSPIRLCVAV